MSDLERKLGDLLAEGKITERDAENIREFQAFLADPEIGPGRRAPTEALRRHQHIIGLSDEDLAQIIRERGETA
jgi:hypothetical protein